MNWMLPARFRARRVFRGIQPPAAKDSTLPYRLMAAPTPPVLMLPLRHGDGPAAIPVVRPGEQVVKYQLLAEAAEPLAAPVHAPAAGTVQTITGTVPGERSGSQNPFIELHCEPGEQALVTPPTPDYRSLGERELLAMVAAAGICGMDGRPAAADLEPGRACPLLIINAVESEPCISSSQSLIRERAHRIVLGASILQTISLAPRCVITIDRRQQDAVAALREALRDSEVQLLPLTTRYPGTDRQIVEVVTGLEIPRGQRPPDQSVLVFDAGVAHAVHNAVVAGRPCISRVVTLTGAALRTPKNLETLIGTPVEFLLRLCGVDPATHAFTIMGGPLQGSRLNDTATPVRKTTACLIAATREEFAPLPAPQPCIRCGACAEVCPVRLLPHQLLAGVRGGDLELLNDYGMTDCIECGACAWVCPSHIPLVSHLRNGRQVLADLHEEQALALRRRDRYRRHQQRLGDGSGETAGSGAQAGRDDQNSPPVSRELARTEIAAAVQRVKSRRRQRAAKPGKSA